MKNIVQHIFWILIFIMAACSNDKHDSCLDINYGQVEVDPENQYPFPYVDNQTIEFEDSLGHVLKFVVSNFYIPNFYSAIDTIFTGPCAGKIVAYGKRQSKFVTFYNDSLNYVLNLQHGVWMEVEDGQP